MDEEKKSEQNNIDSKLKEAVNNELSAYINQETQTPQGLNDSPFVKNITSDTLSEVVKQKVFEPEKIQTRPIVRTYKSDTEETIKTGHISSINIAVAENNRLFQGNKNYEQIEDKKTKINKNIIIISLIIIIGGFLAIGIPYFLTKNSSENNKNTTKTDVLKPIITVDFEEKININDLNLNRVNTTLKERVEQSYTKVGEVKKFYFTEGAKEAETPIASKDFLSLIKANVPSGILRKIEPQYMFGMHNLFGNQRFLILKVNSYDIAFSEMFLWEVDLWQDFEEIFDLNDLESEASSTNAFGKKIKKFQDAVFSNKDCRVVKNTLGQIVFLYSIVDQNTIIITTSLDTLRELINRLNKSTNIVQ